MSAVFAGQNQMSAVYQASKCVYSASADIRFGKSLVARKDSYLGALLASEFGEQFRQTRAHNWVG